MIKNKVGPYKYCFTSMPILLKIEKKNQPYNSL